MKAERAMHNMRIGLGLKEGEYLVSSEALQEGKDAAKKRDQIDTPRGAPGLSTVILSPSHRGRGTRVDDGASAAGPRSAAATPNGLKQPKSNGRQMNEPVQSPRTVDGPQKASPSSPDSRAGASKRKRLPSGVQEESEVTTGARKMKKRKTVAPQTQKEAITPGSSPRRGAIIPETPRRTVIQETQFSRESLSPSDDDTGTVIQETQLPRHRQSSSSSDEDEDDQDNDTSDESATENMLGPTQAVPQLGVKKFVPLTRSSVW